MKTFGAALLTIAALLGTACGPPVPKLAKLDAADVILAFGDSLTAGTGASAQHSYPAALARLISRKVVVSAVPGETTEEGLRRLPAVIAEVRPKLLIVCHGGNDFLRRLDEGKAADNIRRMIRLAREQGVAVLLIATPRPGFGVAKVRFYEDLGKEFAIPVETDVLADVLAANRFKSDLVHPNAEGYAAIAEAVAAMLQKAGAI